MRYAALVAFSLALAGCGGHDKVRPRWSAVPDRITTNPRQLDPQPVLSPSYQTFPAPPKYPVSSCWARKSSGGALYEAPQVPANLPYVSPRELLRQLRANFGEPTVRAAELRPPPPITFQHTGWYGPGVRPPKNALWLYMRSRKTQRTEWAVDLFAGALRDEMCLHRTRPLVGWSDKGVRGVSDPLYPFGQRFPSPSPAVFRQRLTRVGRAYGFRVQSLRFVRALQLAPVVVVNTDDRKRFALDAAAILQRVDPVGDRSITWQGLWFEARDSDGPFLRIFNVHRGVVMSGQWAWDPRYYPYDHG